ncbi:MAG: Type 1 glutamine amidotransferase-like domain-containing protein [Ilumatobacteraceae bacterium]
MRDTDAMTGTIALIGGGEFTEVTASLDRRLLELSGGTEVVVLPTADAFERPDELVAQATAHFTTLGATTIGLKVLTRVQAKDPDAVATLESARFVYLAGDSQLHLRSVLKQTPLWDALLGVLARDGVVAASGASAAALCDPMLDSRGGGVTLGLGLVPTLTFVHRSETLTPDWRKRVGGLAWSAASTMAEATSGSALIHTAAGWEQFGAVSVVGELPAVPDAA